MPFLERDEHDACGIVAWVEKSEQATRDNIEHVLGALDQMRHRAGFVEEEGDGCGILLDIPRELWADILQNHDRDPRLVDSKRFAVAHLVVTKDMQRAYDEVEVPFKELAATFGFQVIALQQDAVHSEVLGPGGSAEQIHFFQFGLLANEEMNEAEVGKACYHLHLAVESQLQIHVASLSNDTVVYKVRGDSHTLRAYFRDFLHDGLKSRATIGHNRYSTNTTTSSERVQPFTLLGHNGELNTIHRLREESRMLDIPTVPGGSDSQDLNRFIEGLIFDYGYTLAEALEVAFPPIINEIKHTNEHLQDMYMFLRSLWGPFAQGPAGIVSRTGAEAAFSVDALGLRPVWQVETETSWVFISEQGVVPLVEMVSDPHPLAPGEKVVVSLPENTPATLHPYHEVQELIYQRMKGRYTFEGFRHSLSYGGSAALGDVHLTPDRERAGSRDKLLGAFGWDQEDLRILEHQATMGAEPIRSLGFDGPLAVLADKGQNVADFLKETVAVVTNPAIDREREIEHFSTRIVLGRRPNLRTKSKKYRHLEIQSPILLGGHPANESDRYRSTALKLGTQLFEDVLRYFATTPDAIAEIYPRIEEDETLSQALERLRDEVLAAIYAGAQLIILDDQLSFASGYFWMDPSFAVSMTHKTLRDLRDENGESERRKCSIVLRSGAIRNLHDMAVLVGLGADAINPYLYFETAFEFDGYKGVENAYSALTKGLEKVISTLGIHELRGYDRLFSAIGLASEVASLLEIKSFFDGDVQAGSFERFYQTSKIRSEALRSGQATVARPYQLWPRIWKVAGDAAGGKAQYSEFAEKLKELEEKNPISLRHLLDVVHAETAKQPVEVDLSIGDHALPFVISSMSFGSQGETAFRSYAIAAQKLDMIAMNGEGGEIKDMLGKYAKNRGHQVASGRFGVNAELCNSADLLEIKIGQGAKPGEGGHLPGSKVSAKVANARNARQGTDLISPSNNHDIYSIEDLAQMIDELKVVNPRAKVAVKVPVVPNIGTIAVGIAKAGADVITLSGFDGGTGAARAHAIKYVGLPVEIGVKLAHEALLDSGLRDQVEIWGDGGMKSGLDVVKLVLLGANRVGFGTMAMIAIGCTSCRGCHKDTCHVGIATQIETQEQAVAHGLKAFVPRQIDLAVANLERYFLGMAEEVKQIVSMLGAGSLQELVGKSAKLTQTRGLEQVNLKDLIEVHVHAAYEYKTHANRPSSVGMESLTAQLGEQAVSAMAAGNEAMTFGASQVHSAERVIGGMISGSVVRSEIRDRKKGLSKASVRLLSGSVVGNGFAAYNATGVHLRVEGGAQDGVGKGALGGKVIIMKGQNRFGDRINGSVGKGLAYGAQRGLFIVQGDADSRAGIRLSGADIIVGGEVTAPIADDHGAIATRANIKGFAFEYMTGGRALVMGDPGPWICSGMTGGVVYLHLNLEMGLNAEALRRRLAKGAKVSLVNLNSEGIYDVKELLTTYQKELVRSGQQQEAQRLQPLIDQPEEHFMRVIAGIVQTDQDIATE